MFLFLLKVGVFYGSEVFAQSEDFTEKTINIAPNNKKHWLYPNKVLP